MSDMTELKNKIKRIDEGIKEIESSNKGKARWFVDERGSKFCIKEEADDFYSLFRVYPNGRMRWLTNDPSFERARQRIDDIQEYNRKELTGRLSKK